LDRNGLDGCFLRLKEELKPKTTMNTTDKEIDAMVARLYGLTDEKLRIVENS
jgi:hypothetical protein